MTTNKKIWVLRPEEKMLWSAKCKSETEFVDRIWLAEWIIRKQKSGDVVIVEQLHVNGTGKEE